MDFMINVFTSSSTYFENIFRPIDLSSDDSTGVHHYNPSKENWGTEVDCYETATWRENESVLSWYQEDSDTSNWRFDTSPPQVSSMHVGTSGAGLSGSRKPQMSVRVPDETLQMSSAEELEAIYEEIEMENPTTKKLPQYLSFLKPPEFDT
ncbi:hypothetical protein L1987_18855 [Smallanthus sonchifolius]|uniref:Uncharacterized protein n=1 Tax=Smallanthus sonchifolius TaxID=185202 RepID=A0ACB9J1G7_9ASTR|nr:hypothetical protein L1987_18855 [Smallanthus sonchifolius]